MNKIFFVMMIFAVLIFSTATTHAEDVGKGKKIIYIPIDNRPINLIQTIEVAEILGYEIMTPPEIFLGTGANDDQFGDPEALWDWLNQNAPRADIAVISTDAMIYGSLVASRKHQLTAEEILERAKKFKNLREDNPYLPLYLFGTIMRTPKSTISTSNTDPAYYRAYAEQIFNYTALKDKSEVQKLSKSEKKEMAYLERLIPKEDLEDWFRRRAKNYNANAYLVDLTKNNAFQYFLVGCDDGEYFSQTHLESRHLTEYGKPLGKEKFQVMSGADELGMLMISRAINNDIHYMPFVAIGYNEGRGGDTIPAFSSEKISTSLNGAILSVGGITVPNPQKADLVLAVNTFPNGETLPVDSPKNNVKPHAGIKYYMKMLHGYLKNNYPVGVVDIATSNGSDNALMEQIKNDDLQFKIRAYGGWNTATNSSGFLIGAGVLTNFMTEKDIYSLLMTRYFNDWIYKANVRTQIDGGLIWTIPGEGNSWNLNERQEGLEKLTGDMVTEFAAKNIFLPRGYSLKNIQARFPWSRTFETEISFDLVK